MLPPLLLLVVLDLLQFLLPSRDLNFILLLLHVLNAHSRACGLMELR